MNFSNLTPISNEHLFFQRFKRTSFLEKVACWSKRFCYGFLFLVATSIFWQGFWPFCGNAPDLFMQLLFLLIFWGTTELLTLPLEYIQDYYIFDFEKNWLALSRQRFFYRRITVIAAFNQIKAIGVSSRPPGVKNLIMDPGQDNYAICIQTLKNQLYQVTDYSLTLEEAQSFCHRLYSSHFSGAAYIGGAPGMEITVDGLTGQIKATQVEKGISQVIDAVSKPIIQSFLAFMLTTSVLTLALSIIQRTSKDLFAADLKIRNQPVFQLILGTTAETVVPEVNSEIGIHGPASITMELPDSASITIDLARQVISTPQPAATSTAPVAETSTATQPQQEPLPEPEKDKQPVEVVIYAENPKPVSVPEIVEVPAETSAKTDAKTLARNEKKQTVLAIKPPATTVPVPVFQTPATRVPDFDPGNANADSAPAIHPTDYSGAKKTTISPGKGILPYVSLGDSLDSVIARLGPPIATHRSGTGKQMVFNGLTIISESRDSDKINLIIITQPQTGTIGQLVTENGISIGSSVSLPEKFLGPYTVLPDDAGIHFGNLGISFFPAPLEPERIGAIQIYRPQAKRANF